MVCMVLAVDDAVRVHVLKWDGTVSSLTNCSWALAAHAPKLGVGMCLEDVLELFMYKLPPHIHSYLPWPTESTCIVALLVLCFLAQ